MTVCLLAGSFGPALLSAQQEPIKPSYVSDAVEPQASGETAEPVLVATAQEPVEELPAPEQEPTPASGEVAASEDAVMPESPNPVEPDPAFVPTEEKVATPEIEPIRDPEISAAPTLQPYLGARVVKNGLGSITVVRVRKGTPAQAGGLVPGDAITHVDGNEVDSFEALMLVLLKKEPGDAVELKLQRRGQSKSLEIVLGGR
jgi:membrane-associated protease RseP (regulator of RpoE activity)